MIKFSVWLENMQNDSVRDAVLGIVGGGSDLNFQEKQHFLQRNTKEFSNEILKKIINLGIIKELSQINPDKFISIKNLINNGISIGELIDKIKGENLAPNAELES
jgi:hypothetical protein